MINFSVVEIAIAFLVILILAGYTPSYPIEMRENISWYDFVIVFILMVICILIADKEETYEKVEEEKEDDYYSIPSIYRYKIKWSERVKIKTRFIRKICEKVKRETVKNYLNNRYGIRVFKRKIIPRIRVFFYVVKI